MQKTYRTKIELIYEVDADSFEEAKELAIELAKTETISAFHITDMSSFYDPEKAEDEGTSFDWHDCHEGNGKCGHI